MRALLFELCHLLHVLSVLHRHLIDVVLRAGRSDGACGNVLDGNIEHLQSVFTDFGSSTSGRNDFFELLDDQPQPLRRGSFKPLVRRWPSRLGSAERCLRLLLRLGGWGSFRHLLALVLATAPSAAEFEGHDGPFHV